MCFRAREQASQIDASHQSPFETKTHGHWVFFYLDSALR